MYTSLPDSLTPQINPGCQYSQSVFGLIIESAKVWTCLNRDECMALPTHFVTENLSLVCCPKCGGDLAISEDKLQCKNCHQIYTYNEGILSLFFPNEWEPDHQDVTQDMKAFYEKYPFPNYDDFDDAGSLIDKARQGIFARLLSEQIPPKTKVLECGCGTGQLSNFLSIGNRTVVGADMCLNSLKMANDFKLKNNLDRAHFVQMNLFRPAFKTESFDFVISNGVLHHTSDPYRAFESISTLVKPGGYILVGLYHKYGRLVTDFRRKIFALTNDRFKFLDVHASDKRVSQDKRQAWFMDQYKNPHESKHTVPEVLKWLDKTGFTFVNSVPKTKPFQPTTSTEQLFKRSELGNPIERLMVNTGMFFKGHLEGGFFIVIARKNKS